jgi:flagellar biosynthesis/type III secretory pathway ATPase
MGSKLTLAPYIEEVDRIATLRWTGRVTDVVGLLIESRGPHAAIGDFCEISASGGR